MKLILTRHRQQSEAIDGRLTIDGQFVCDTAERASTPLKAGSYHLHIGLCKKLRRKMLLLERCTSCCESCPIVKHGNGIYTHTRGTILVGTTICPGCLKHSRRTYSNLFQRLRKSTERGNELQLIIQETFKNVN